MHDSPSPSALPNKRGKKIVKVTGLILINVVLAAIVVGILVATWLPAYVDRHPHLKIGQSTSKAP